MQIIQYTLHNIQNAIQHTHFAEHIILSRTQNIQYTI